MGTSNSFLTLYRYNHESFNAENNWQGVSPPNIGWYMCEDIVVTRLEMVISN